MEEKNKVSWTLYHSDFGWYKLTLRVDGFNTYHLTTSDSPFLLGWRLKRIKNKLAKAFKATYGRKLTKEEMFNHE